MNFSFIPTPRNASEAAFQARVMDRANSLKADGYRLLLAADVTGYEWYNVITPEGKQYTVDFLANTCGCECCIKHHFCKHLIAVHLEVARKEEAADAAMVAAYEADMAACENEKTGVDYWF
jgi:uncharacterized Zn finger protein